MHAGPRLRCDLHRLTARPLASSLSSFFKKNKCSFRGPPKSNAGLVAPNRGLYTMRIIRVCSDTVASASVCPLQTNHCMRMPWTGCPARWWSTWADESRNRELAVAARAVHSMTFERDLLMRFHSRNVRPNIERSSRLPSNVVRSYLLQTPGGPAFATLKLQVLHGQILCNPPSAEGICRRYLGSRRLREGTAEQVASHHGCFIPWGGEHTPDVLGFDFKPGRSTGVGSVSVYRTASGAGPRGSLKDPEFLQLFWRWVLGRLRFWWCAL